MRIGKASFAGLCPGLLMLAAGTAQAHPLAGHAGGVLHPLLEWNHLVIVLMAGVGIVPAVLHWRLARRRRRRREIVCATQPCRR